MKRMSNILMAGAAGRNLGKTEFLCRAIRAQCKRVPVIGIKITTIDDSLAAYRDIEKDWRVSAEEPADDNKDTHRMYRAGAHKVYWLRVKRPALFQGLEALFQTLEADGFDPSTACLVIESAGTREFISPGLFFIIREQGDELKPSAAAVAHLADRLVEFNGGGWDLQPEELCFENGSWGLKENAAAIILSGGGSRRMGENKSLIPVNGEPLISSIVHQLLPNLGNVMISGSPETYAFTNCRVVPDREPDRGPLMGLWSALSASTHELNFVTACDIPEIHLPFVRRMLREIGEHDAVVPIVGTKLQPHFSVYKKEVATTIGSLLAEGRQSMHALLDRLNILQLKIDGDWYHNLNTRDDLKAYRKRKA